MVVWPPPGPIVTSEDRGVFIPILGNHRSLRNKSGDRKPLPESSAPSGPLLGTGELPLACDSTPHPQLYFRPRRGEKAISREALTSMLGMR